MVEASDLLLEEIEILAFKQECWNAYVDSVIKTSPYFYLLPVLSFIAFIVSMLIFAHYYEFTSLYVTQLFYFTGLPVMFFTTIFNFSTSAVSFEFKA